MAASGREYGASVTQRIFGLWQQGTVAASVRKLFMPSREFYGYIINVSICQR